MKTKNLLSAFTLVLILCLTGLNIFAQVGSNDPAFNTTDIGNGSGHGPGSVIASAIMMPAGKVLIVGDATYNGMLLGNPVMLNVDGTPDLSFNSGGTGAAGASALALQPDGKILMGGLFSSYNGTSISGIARLNSDGSLDTGFDPGLGANNFVKAIAIQSDGKIIIGGTFTSFNGVSVGRIVRLNADGSVDGTFSAGTGMNQTIESISIQNTGKIIVGGWFSTVNGTPANHLVRLNTDGSVDGTFASPGAGSDIFKTIIQPDGKILIAGCFVLYEGSNENHHIARLEADGSWDASFGPGVYSASSIAHMALQDDGKIIVVGSLTYVNFGSAVINIARFLPDGNYDYDFTDSVGTSSPTAISRVFVQPNGKILVSGSQLTAFDNHPANFFARLNSSGSVDKTFNPLTSANNEILDAEIQSDGKIIIAGSMTGFNDSLVNRIERLNSNGTQDPVFYTFTGPNSKVRNVAVQSDGKIMVAGDFTAIGATSSNRIARLNANGTYDASFNPGTGLNGSANTLTIQTDGYILIGGMFSTFNGTAESMLVRVDPSGTLDPLFNTGTGLNSSVNDIAIQSNGKILLGGGFTTINGTSSSHIGRMNSDGSLDGSFIVGTGADNVVNTIALQADGKILIGGNFITYNGTSRNRIARLNADGTLDTSFDPGTGFDQQVYSIKVQADGKIWIGGAFTNFNGTSVNRYVRINSNGTLDASFNSGSGANGTVNSIRILANGKPMIFGNFTNVSGDGRNHIALLLNCGAVTTTLNAAICPGQTYTFGSTSISTGGVYTDIFPLGTGCDSTVTLTLVIDSVSMPSITVAAGILTSSASAGNQWYMNGSIIPGETNQTYTPSQSALYSVTVSNTLGCSASSATIDITLSVNRNANMNAFVTYPNPSKGEFNIEFSNEQLVEEISIYSILGETVFSTQPDSYLLSKTIFLDVPAGSYIMKVRSASGISTQHLLIY